MHDPAVPYWRLSAFYLAFFATLGALLPYWSLYLESRGLTPAGIGALMAVLMVTKLVAPNIWGWLADRRGRHLGLVRVAAWVSLAAFAGVLVVDGWWPLAAVMGVFGFFWNATLPQFEAVTLNHLGASPGRYPSIRLWGSVGFIVVVLGLGRAIERHGIGIVPAAVLVAMAAIALASLSVDERPGGGTARASATLGTVLRRPAVRAFLLACLLMQASHGPYYVFFSIYLRDHGYAPPVVGALWALGVAAEVVLFAVMSPLLARWGRRALLLASFALTALRWVLIATLPGHLAVLALAQLLHAATFGLYHACAIQFVHQQFSGRLQGRGQALYSSLSFGAGGALGAALSGALWQSAGPGATWAFAALAAAGGGALVWRWVDRPALSPPARVQSPFE